MFRKTALLISLLSLAQPGFAQSLFKDVVNEITKEAARQGAAKVITESSQGSYSGSRKEFADLQRALKARGFDPGVIDGLSGPSTRRAVRQYQAANGFPVTGSLTAGQKSRLLGGNSAAAGLGAVSILTPLIKRGGGSAGNSEGSATGGAGASVGDLTTSSSGITRKQSDTDQTTTRTTARTETTDTNTTSQGDGDLLRQLRDEVAKTNSAAEGGSQQTTTQRTRDTTAVQATTTTGSAESVSSGGGTLSEQQQLREQKRQEALCRRDPTRCPK